MEPGWSEPPPVPYRRTKQRAARGTLLAPRGTGRNSQRQLEIGQGGRQRRHQGKRTWREGQHERRRALRPRQGYRREIKSSRQSTAQGQRACWRLGSLEQPKHRRKMGTGGSYQQLNRLGAADSRFVSDWLEAA